MGQCTANARRPTVDSRCCGTTISCCVADLRWTQASNASMSAHIDTPDTKTTITLLGVTSFFDLFNSAESEDVAESVGFCRTAV